jgi:hypothetical protein
MNQTMHNPVFIQLYFIIIFKTPKRFDPCATIIKESLHQVMYKTLNV